MGADIGEQCRVSTQRRSTNNCPPSEGAWSIPHSFRPSARSHRDRCRSPRSPRTNEDRRSVGHARRGGCFVSGDNPRPSSRASVGRVGSPRGLPAPRLICGQAEPPLATFLPEMQMLTRVLSVATRTFTGLITVWCLGCSGFDPLLGALLGASRGMSCASEMSASAPESQPGTASVQDASTAERGVDCGCGSCHAASPVAWVGVVDTPATPDLVRVTPVEPLSVTRAPVVPPPESSAS
jgi:hypothetical protein